eukprot:jgi/Galph1/45/GphlegSOOS_G4855.1
MKISYFLTEGEYRLFQWIVFLGGSFYGGWLLYRDYQDRGIYAARKEARIAEEKKKQRPITEEYWRELQDMKPRNLEEFYKEKEEEARKRREKVDKLKRSLVGWFGYSSPEAVDYTNNKDWGQ